MTDFVYDISSFDGFVTPTIIALGLSFLDVKLGGLLLDKAEKCFSLSFLGPFSSWKTRVLTAGVFRTRPPTPIGREDGCFESA